MVEKQQICKKRLDAHAKDFSIKKKTLSVFGAHFPDETREPVNTPTTSDVLKESAKWFAVDVATSKFLSYVALGMKPVACTIA